MVVSEQEQGRAGAGAVFECVPSRACDSMSRWLGCGPGNLGVDPLVRQHAVLALGRQSGILWTLGICQQGLLAIDKLEEGIVLRVGDPRLVGYYPAHLARGRVRPYGQRPRLQGAIALVGYDDAQDAGAGRQAAGAPLGRENIEIRNGLI